MGSWGHSIRRLTPDEQAHLERMRERYGDRFYACATRGCLGSAVFKVAYRYVTGRAGRTSVAERAACEKHAEAFAAKYGLEVPAEPSERTEHPGYETVSQLISGGERS